MTLLTPFPQVISPKRFPTELLNKPYFTELQQLLMKLHQQYILSKEYKTQKYVTFGFNVLTLEEGLNLLGNNVNPIYVHDYTRNYNYVADSWKLSNDTLKKDTLKLMKQFGTVNYVKKRILNMFVNKKCQ